MSKVAITVGATVVLVWLTHRVMAVTDVMTLFVPSDTPFPFVRSAA